MQSKAELFAPSDRTLPAILRRQVARYGDRPLVRWAGEAVWTYAETLARAEDFAYRLLHAGIGFGDRVALICTNRPEFLSIFLGCAWMGAILVPINIAARGPQLRHILSNAQPRLLVAEAEFLQHLVPLDPSGLEMQRIWSIGPSAMAEWGGCDIVPMPDRAEAITPLERQPGPADIAAILYTSGTTGPSKGVCCPQAQLFWWGYNCATLLELGEDEVLCTTLPLFHVNALHTFYQALLTGSLVAYEPRFSASSFWQVLKERGATVTYLLGAMVPILLSREPSAEERGHKVRVALSPGTPERFHAPFLERSGIGLLDGYGSTETNFVLGTTVHRTRPGLMGPVAKGFEARVVDSEDCEVPDGTPGELVVRADEPFAMASGYFRMPEKTVEAWRNLWFHSGDRVIREPDGYFRFVDRLKEAIRRRGENVSSYEVEQVLLSHPVVAGAAVYPVAAEMGEDEVMAALVLKQGCALSAPDLIAFCEPLLAYYAIPRYVEFLAELPLTENGKVRKYLLQDRGVAETTWDREKAGYKLKRR
jgi:crotonobetaine/carnitine-CoA ligase